MEETATTKTAPQRIPGGFLFGAGVIVALVGFVLFVLGQSVISVVMILGGLLLAVLGKLQTFTAAKKQSD